MSTIDPPRRPTGPAKPTTTGKPRLTPASDDQTRFAKALEHKRGEDGGKSGPTESRDSLFRSLRQAREQARGAPRPGQGLQPGSPDGAPDHDPSADASRVASTEDMLRSLHRSRDEGRGSPGARTGNAPGAPGEQDPSSEPTHLPSAQDMLRGLRQPRQEEGLRTDRKDARAAHEDDDDGLTEGGPVTDQPETSLVPATVGQRGDGDAGGDGESDDRDRDTSDEPEGVPDPTQVRSAADAVLAGFRQRLEDTTVSAPAEAAHHPRATLSDLVRDVAERITVGESGPAGQQEVRIMLKDEVLGGTEVRITEHEGAIQITFVAGTKDAEQLLEGQREGFSHALGERLGRDVRVAVTDREGADAQSQNDGRSRNRRSVPDER